MKQRGTREWARSNRYRYTMKGLSFGLTTLDLIIGVKCQVESLPRQTRKILWYNTIPYHTTYNIMRASVKWKREMKNQTEEQRDNLLVITIATIE
jgi:hypothetical protein